MRIIHTTTSRELIRQLETAGWVLDRVRGSHHVFTKPGQPPVIVLHPRKTLGKGLVATIRRQAGL